MFFMSNLQVILTGSFWLVVSRLVNYGLVLCMFNDVFPFASRRGLGIFLFTTASRKALGPTQPPIQWVPGDLFLGVKRPGREADHSPPSSTEVKNV
jgi:hypothetical protein